MSTLVYAIVFLIGFIGAVANYVSAVAADAPKDRASAVGRVVFCTFVAGMSAAALLAEAHS